MMQDEPLDDNEGFELPPVDLGPEIGAESDMSDSDVGGGAGDFGLELNMPDRKSVV